MHLDPKDAGGDTFSVLAMTPLASLIEGNDHESVAGESMSARMSPNSDLTGQ